MIAQDSADFPHGQIDDLIQRDEEKCRKKDPGILSAWPFRICIPRAMPCFALPWSTFVSINSGTNLASCIVLWSGHEPALRPPSIVGLLPMVKRKGRPEPTKSIKF